MINLDTLTENYETLVGFFEQQGIVFDESSNLVTSDSSLFVNEISGIDLILAKRSIALTSAGEETETITEYLERLRATGIKHLAANLITELQGKYAKKNNVGEVFTTNERAFDLSENTGAFNGFYLKIKPGLNFVVSIKKLVLQLIQAENAPIFVFNANKKELVYKFDFSSVGYNRVYAAPEIPINEETELNEIIFNSLSENGIENEYLIGYFEHNSNIASPDQLEPTNAAYVSKFTAKEIEGVEYFPISIPKENHIFEDNEYQFFDIDTINSYKKTESNGLGLNISVQFDITDILVKYKMSFAILLQKLIALQVINGIINTREINRESQLPREQYNQIKVQLKREIWGFQYQNEDQNRLEKQPGLLDNAVQLLENVINFNMPDIKNNNVFLLEI